MSKYKVVMSENSNYYDAINHSFDGNVCILNTNSNIKEIETVSRKLTSTDTIILFNLTTVNDLLLNMLPRDVKKYLIFEYSIAELSEYVKLNEFLLIMKYLNMQLIDGIYCLNYTTYSLFKDKYKAKYLQLDIPKSENKSGSSIGIITSSIRQYSSTMNALSAVSLTEFREIRIYNIEKSVKKFAKKFHIRVYLEKTLDDAINNNDINLYVNFSETCYDLILKSMDRGIPCIVGNTDFFNSNETLKKYLVLKSDDDINEIKEKILSVKKNKKSIMKEYQKFRKEYKKLASTNLSEVKKNF